MYDYKLQGCAMNSYVNIPVSLHEFDDFAGKCMAKEKLNWGRKPKQINNLRTVVREPLLNGELSPNGFRAEL